MTPDSMLKIPRYKNLFNAIAAGEHRKMPCGDIRAARQLLSAGLLRLTGKRDDVTTSWSLTDIGEAYAKE